MGLLYMIFSCCGIVDLYLRCPCHPPIVLSWQGSGHVRRRSFKNSINIARIICGDLPSNGYLIKGFFVAKGSTDPISFCASLEQCQVLVATKLDLES